MAESVINQTAETPSIRRIQWFTIIWMTVDVVVALVAAVRAHSVALAAFGGDSAIELLSAGVVLARFRAIRGISERLATKITGWLLVALAAYIVAHSLYTLLAAESRLEVSYLGIGLLFADLKPEDKVRKVRELASQYGHATESMTLLRSPRLR